ncbi:J domain-containing protein [Desulfotomaculum copahuensis]|uniref:J domain-containing protein n=1 Tax=Desulfotomaculum copahuensis TaxID=1838280 RepID=A0A1B7LFB7_9FIRM|nr:DnaJ domain-containing protein [Desulfotomaculum copahuensis]OAT82355.1 hypothetical protein A6M21_09430 [Desulfotomaculum copahuensis]
MAFESNFRRKKRKPKVENYYKILGTRANAGPETIKKRYIEAVKAFPPETHPEEFQQIRRAYETLRDPVKRNEYNLLRKYGGQIEDVMNDAFELAEAGKYNQAANLLNQVLTVSPASYQARLALAQISLLQGDESSFQEQFQAAYDVIPEDNKAAFLCIKARMLMETDRVEEAGEVLKEFQSRYPDQVTEHPGLFCDVYLRLGMREEAWAMAQSALPEQDSPSPDDIYLLTNWFHVLFEAEKWQLLSAAQSRMRKFLKSIKDEEDKQMILSILKGESKEYFEAGRFREAAIIMDFAYYLDHRNPRLKEYNHRLQEMARVEKEIHRMQMDIKIFPLLSTYAVEWFYRGFIPDEDIQSLWNIIPPEFNMPPGKDLYNDEMLAESINYLKRKYPLTYRYFQEDWEQMFRERTAHLNRESRRKLR